MRGWQVLPSADSRRQSTKRGESAVETTTAVPPSETTAATTPVYHRLLTKYLVRSFIFVVTLLPMLLSIATLLLLVSEGMFDRLVVSENAQTTKYYWSPYGQSCILDKNGFVPNTCKNDELTVTPAAAFSAIGTVLAQQWAAEMKEAGGRLRVTTCTIGGRSNGWANFQFIAGYDRFPECLPVGPQDVAGMAMLETTIRENHVDGLYFLTLYSDLDPAMRVVQYENSDGTMQNVIQNPKRTLITAEGEIEEDDVGTNYIIHSRPLGARYLVTGLCVTIIQELSVQIPELEGWSRGKHSQDPVVPGWSCGHRVDNSGELIVLQSLFAVLTLGLFTGDLYVTFTGFRDLESDTHLLAHTVLSGLERRKALLVCIVLNALPSLLYLDVSRIYHFTETGQKLWVASCLMVSTFFSFGLLLVLSLVDTIPLRCHNKCIGYSAPLFLLAAVVSTTSVCASRDSHQFAYNKFYAADPYLGLWINNATWPSGSYVSTGTPVVLTYLVDKIVYPILSALGAAIIFSASVRFLWYRCLLVDTTWCRTNSFLSQVKVPNFLTALPLAPSDAVHLGHEVYCRPSTLAVMGYATVERRSIASSKHLSTHVPCTVISIYSLAAAMFVPGWCEAIGVIERNRFKPSATTCTLDADTKHVCSRGVCVV